MSDGGNKVAPYGLDLCSHGVVKDQGCLQCENVLREQLEAAEREKQEWIERGMSAQGMFADCNETRMELDSKLQAAERARDDAKAFSVCESCQKEEPDWANPMHCHSCYMTLNLNYQNALAREAALRAAVSDIAFDLHKKYDPQSRILSALALVAVAQSLEKALSASRTDHDYVVVRRGVLATAIQALDEGKEFQGEVLEVSASLREALGQPRSEEKS